MFCQARPLWLFAAHLDYSKAAFIEPIGDDNTILPSQTVSGDKMWLSRVPMGLAPLFGCLLKIQIHTSGKLLHQAPHQNFSDCTPPHHS